MVEQDLHDKVLGKKMPDYRKAYSDRAAWLMAYMSELAYLKFDKSAFEGEAVLKLVQRALRGLPKSSDAKILGAITKACGQDYEAEEARLSSRLKKIGWTLAKTISVNATQAFVAYSTDHAVLAFRGTESTSIRDIRADLKSYKARSRTGGHVHAGFQGQYNDVEDAIEAALDMEGVANKPLFITGHSLGGAVATIATRRLSAERQIAACYTYGSPRSGSEAWLGQIKSPVYRIVNSADVVPMVPLTGTAIALLTKGLRALGRLAPFLTFLVWIGNMLERYFSGYEHGGNMRFITNCKDGDFSRATLLYTVGWGRRVRAIFNGTNKWGSLLSDHSIATYQTKLLHIALKRST